MSEESHRDDVGLYCDVFWSLPPHDTPDQIMQLASQPMTFTLADKSRQVTRCPDMVRTAMASMTALIVAISFNHATAGAQTAPHVVILPPAPKPPALPETAATSTKFAAPAASGSVTPANAGPFATGIVTAGRYSYRVEFRRQGPAGVLFVSDATGVTTGTRFVAIENPDAALRYLADRRFAFLWPALLEWAGPGLEKFRDAIVALARDNAANAIIDMPGPSKDMSPDERTRVALRYASALEEAGDVLGAQAWLAQFAEKLDLTNEDDLSSWALARLRQARLSFRQGQPDDALRLLGTGPDAVMQSPYKINLDVNKAALLVEAGLYAEGLATINAAGETFDTSPKMTKGSGAKVRGSDRQFNWIRACALHGLGRQAEARDAMKAVDASRSGPPIGNDIETTLSIRLRAAACMRDPVPFRDAALEDVQGDYFSSAWALWLQPEFWNGRYSAMLKQVREDPQIKAAIAERFRDLPASLVPALNHWQQGAAP